MSMHNREGLENILKDIRIKKHRDVMRQYIDSDRDLYNYYVKRNIDKSFQLGGGVKKIKYNFEGLEFILFERKDRYGIDISVHRKDDNDDPQMCLHIQIDQEQNIANINNISYYPDCVRIGLDHPGGGSTLSKLGIKFLKENKDRLGISRIQLKDNSLFPCSSNKKRIQLATMHTLAFGNTWYGKYGFRPYDSYNNEPDNVLLKLYDRNKFIVRNTKVNDTNLFKYLTHALAEEQPNATENKINDRIKKMMGKYGDLTIGDFFRMFLLKFDKICSAFSRFYIQYATDHKLYDFHGRSFYLDI